MVLGFCSRNISRVCELQDIFVLKHLTFGLPKGIFRMVMFCLPRGPKSWSFSQSKT